MVNRLIEWLAPYSQTMVTLYYDDGENVTFIEEKFVVAKRKLTRAYRMLPGVVGGRAESLGELFEVGVPGKMTRRIVDDEPSSRRVHLYSMSEERRKEVLGNN